MKNSDKPSAHDVEAANALIKLMGSDRFKSLLKDKINKKKNVWAQIVKEMMALGYNFGGEIRLTTVQLTISHSQHLNSGKLLSTGCYDEVKDIIKDSSKAIP